MPMIQNTEAVKAIDARIKELVERKRFLVAQIESATRDAEIIESNLQSLYKSRELL